MEILASLNMCLLVVVVASSDIQVSDVVIVEKARSRLLFTHRSTTMDDQPGSSIRVSDSKGHYRLKF